MYKMEKGERKIMTPGDLNKLIERVIEKNRHVLSQATPKETVEKSSNQIQIKSSESKNQAQI